MRLPRFIADEDAEAFGRLLEELPGPVLAYCRTGTRCTNAWALGMAGDMSPHDIITAAASAGSSSP